ncbi:hypothetical protein ACI2JM_10030 [Psychrobacter sp. NPDC064578]|uniref:hypothetical protein n=1 Tax=Psychrobacter sp. NPDC064578 TaxID=3364493 RepID=UPI0038515E1C
MNDKTVNDNSTTAGEQKNHEPTQGSDKTQITPPTGMFSRSVGDSHPESKYKDRN